MPSGLAPLLTNWDDIWLHGLKLLLAYALALPVGWDRERRERSAGLRTFPLVAIASCGFVLVAQQVLGQSDAQARVIEGIITGMGFIGGGAILKQAQAVRGTATAASLWATGALGAAVGYGQLDIACVISLATFATLRFMTPLKGQESGIDDAMTTPRGTVGEP